METKTVSGRGESFLQDTLENHRKDGWKVEHLTHGSFGKFVVVFTKDVSTPPGDVAPSRPDQ